MIKNFCLFISILPLLRQVLLSVKALMTAWGVSFKERISQKLLQQAYICFAFLLSVSSTQAAIRYVKPTATGTGTGASWANASGNLQAMINASAVNDQVWVAAGTYKPTNKPYSSGTEITTSDNRDKAFHVKDGVKIYGGFAGTESTLGSRDITTNVTILSGDIGTINDSTDNCYHVVIASGYYDVAVGVTIDGFSITGGNANGSSTIIVLSAYRDDGGGIHVMNGANTITNNTLYRNSATDEGGGMHITINYSSSSYNNTISNNTLYQNSSDYGSGIYIYGAELATNTIRNNTLYYNKVFTGTIYLDGTTNGSTIYIVNNNTVYKNNANFNGGIFIDDGTNTISNNIFWQNQGFDFGYRSAYYSPNNHTVKNNLFQSSASTYSSVYPAYRSLGPYASGNLFARSPAFVDAAAPAGADGKPRTADDGLAISGCSMAIDAGINTNTPTLDILGNGIYNTTKDMGAYERQSGQNFIPTPFNVIGSGAYCQGSTSNVQVALTNSELNVDYQLINSPTNIGTPIAGTGSILYFGPQPMGVYTIEATSTDGCKTSMNGSAYVSSLTLPTITTAASPAICTDALSFQIPYTATTGTPTTYSISGTGITTVTGNALPATPITVNLSSPASGSSISYTLTVKNANGCTSSNVTGSVMVNANPTPTITGLNATYCKTSGLINLAATPAGGTFMVNGLSASSFDTDLLTIGATNTVDYSYTDGNGCSGAAPQATFTVIGIPAAPTITSSLSSPQCLNSTVTITAPSADKYAWYKDGAFLKWATSPNNTLVVTATSTNANYAVYTYNAATNNCPSTLSNSISVIGSAPVAAITPSFAAPYCANNAPVLSGVPPTGSNYTYSWTCPTCSTTTNSSTITPTAQFGDYYVTVTDGNGCSRTSPKLNVVLNAMPVANAGADVAACLNTATLLGGTTASTGYAYSWYPATNLSATNIAKPNVTATSTTPITYTFRVTRTTTGCYAEDQVVATGSALPSVATLSSSSSSAVCAPATITLTPSVSNSVFWYKNGILMSPALSSGAKVISSSSQSSDAYTIANYNGTCMSAQSSPVSVTINTAPQPTISSTPAVVFGGSYTVSICNGQTTGTAALVASVPSGSPTISSYNWQQAISGINTNLSPAVTSSNYTASVAASPISQNNKSFRVQANYANGCSANSLNVLVKLLPTTCIVRMNGNSEENLAASFTAYPNPTSDKLTVFLSNYPASEGELFLYNNLGQLVLKQSISLTEGRAEESIDLSSLAVGMYNLVFQTKDGQEVQKIVKSVISYQ